MQPTYFIHHGGGPCFSLGPGPMRETWSELESYLRRFVSTPSERPGPILVVSGHREEGRPTVNAGAAPTLLFNDADGWLREAMLDGAAPDGALIGGRGHRARVPPQPHEDHLLPLTVVAGVASGEPGHTDFRDHALGRPISGFRLG